MTEAATLAALRARVDAQDARLEALEKVVAELKQAGGAAAAPAAPVAPKQEQRFAAPFGGPGAMVGTRKM